MLDLAYADPDFGDKEQYHPDDQKLFGLVVFLSHLFFLQIISVVQSIFLESMNLHDQNSQKKLFVCDRHIHLQTLMQSEPLR